MMALLLAAAACLPVEGNRILMRDLSAAVAAFAGLDPEEPLGFTPAPGAQRRFSAGSCSGWQRARESRPKSSRSALSEKGIP